MRRRVGGGIAAVVVGVAAVAVGVALVVTGVSVLPRGYGHAAALVAGGATAVLGVGVAARGLVAGGDRWHPDDPAPGLSVGAPGDDLLDAPDREFRDRLRDHVVTALVEQGDSRETAVEKLDDGSWTDDRFVAAYLGDESLRDALAIRLHALGSSDPVGSTLRRRTVEELQRLRDGAEP